MPNDSEPQTTIYVHEHYLYEVQLGAQQITRCTKSWISVNVTIPYLGYLLHRGKRLKNIVTDTESLCIGQIHLKLPNSPEHTIPLILPAGPDLQTHLKSGRQARIIRSFTIPPAQSPLVDVRGEIYDSDLSEQTDKQSETEEEAETGPELLSAFARDTMRLKLTLAVSDFAAQQQRLVSGEIRHLLLGDHQNIQFFLPDLNNVAKLSQTMAALANSSTGGRILLGLSQFGEAAAINGDTAEQRTLVERSLLRAALRCNPSVPFSPPAFMASEGALIARIEVPGNSGQQYQIKDLVFRLEGTEILDAVALQARPLPSLAVTNLLDGLEEAVELNGTDEVIVLDAKDKDLHELELGEHICGLINADQRDGLIVLRNFFPKGRSFLFNRNHAVFRQLEQYVNDELKHLRPRVFIPRPKIVVIGKRPVIVLQVSSEHVPAALYREEAFAWTNRMLHTLPFHEAISRYLQRLGLPSSSSRTPGQVQLIYAELAQPIQPFHERPREPHFDIQRQAMVWNPRNFIGPEDRLQCPLEMPLRQALVTDSILNQIPQRSATLQGQMHVCFNNILVSGADVEVVTGVDLRRQLRVHKQTHVRISVIVEAGQLFKRRHRSIQTCIRLPDVLLNIDRINDIRHICADLGCTIADLDYPDPEEGMVKQLTLKANRSHNFSDMTLVLKASCERAHIRRELRQRDRTDRSLSYRSVLLITVNATATGEQASAELANLQLRLCEMLSWRLRYLRTE